MHSSATSYLLFFKVFSLLLESHLLSVEVIFPRKSFSSLCNMIFSSQSYFCLKSFKIHFVLKFQILINPNFNHWYEFFVLVQIDFLHCIFSMSSSSHQSLPNVNIVSSFSILTCNSLIGSTIMNLSKKKNLTCMNLLCFSNFKLS